MSSPQRNRNRPLSNKESGALAEIFVTDTRYRDALNTPYTSENPTTGFDTLHEDQEAADAVLSDTIKHVGINADPETMRWQAGRQAVLLLLSRKALGSFENYFLGVDAIPTIAEAEPKLLPEGEFEVTATNNRIVRYGKSIDDPIEFFDTSLGVINRHKTIGHNKIGPENYATAMKIFSDKYSSLEDRANDRTEGDTLTLPDFADVKELADEALRGFFDIASRDTPNYLEMTNIYAAIRGLPKGVIGAEFTHDILLHTTKTMDQYDRGVARVLLAAISKIDTSEYQREASAIVNMMLHRVGEFQSTRDLRTTVRAIDSLKKNPQTDAALDAFFTLSEGFDEPLELEGVDEVVDRLHHIVSEVTEDLGLSVRAKNFADKCMGRANKVARQLLAGGNLTQAQVAQLKETYFRIKTNYQSM